MTQIPDLNLLILCALALAVLLALLIWTTPRRTTTARRRTTPRRVNVVKDPLVPPNAILVDGSNVMHWGGEPSEQVLIAVVRALTSNGFSPVVVFDASVGHKLAGRYLHGDQMAARIGLPYAHVYVVHKGVVADEVLLDLATDHGLRIVTNDRYRDWTAAFPLVKSRDRLVRGEWRQGTVMLRM